jgi:hypothetical protein
MFKPTHTSPMGIEYMRLCDNPFLRHTGVYVDRKGIYYTNVDSSMERIHPLQGRKLGDLVYIPATDSLWNKTWTAGFLASTELDGDGRISVSKYASLDDAEWQSNWTWEEPA